MHKPTNGELEILRILWQESPASVRQINERMNASLGPDDKEIGYTTTLKLMQIMFERGLLSRKLDGKAHLYEAAVSEAETQQQLVDRLLDTAFHGSAMKLVMQALGSRSSSPKELDEIRRYLDQLSESSSSDH